MINAKPSKQVAALPFRKHKGTIEVMLVTSRETKRWIIPKGWPISGLKNFNAAKREALEEAGVTGRVGRTKLGTFGYNKRLKDGVEQPCRVVVYKLQVTEQLRNWAEKKQRQRKWFSLNEAAELVDTPELKSIIFKLAKKSKTPIRPT